MNSEHVTVAQPLVWSESGVWIIRRWYPGVHPDKHHRPTESDIYGLAHWLKEHRSIGCSVPFRSNVNKAICIRFLMMGMQNLDDSLIRAILEGKDLLHADLIPENILLGNKKPVILDSESVSVGHLVWDAAQVLTFILRVDEDDQIASEFLDEIGFAGVDKNLVWTLVNLFKKS
ncbi:phosphotransferase [Dehalococcoidia bacterium]|nr:phosphotransferase [Dehalococcoidia bacterium]